MKAFKFKIIRPSKEIVAKFVQILSLCRELYNAGLQERRDAYKLNQISISYQDQQNQLPEIKTIRDDLSNVYSQVLQDALKRLDKTFKAFFSRVKKSEKAGFPRFKGENHYESFTILSRRNFLNAPKEITYLTARECLFSTFRCGIRHRVSVTATSV